MQKARAISISDEIIKEIDSYRKKIGLSRSAIIRQAVVEFLEREDAKQ